MSFLKPRPEPAKEVVTLYGGPKDGEIVSIAWNTDRIHVTCQGPTGREVQAVYDRSQTHRFEFEFKGIKPAREL